MRAHNGKTVFKTVAFVRSAILPRGESSLGARHRESAMRIGVPRCIDTPHAGTYMDWVGDEQCPWAAHHGTTASYGITPP